MNTLNTSIEEILAATEFVAVDVGARTDIPGHWLVLDGHARFVAFEPDEDACVALRAKYDARGHGHLYRLFPIALSGTGGPRTLHVTNTASGSSLLSPDTPMNRAYVDHGYLFPITTRIIETQTLERVLDEVGVSHVEVMKIDVEGASLEVLEGLGSLRTGHLLCVEVEVAISAQCEGEGTLFDMHAYMMARDFELLDMRPMYSRLTRNGTADAYQHEIFGVRADSTTLSGRLLHVEALYFRHASTVLQQGADAIRRMVVVYSTYGFFAEAYDLVERAEERKLFNETDANRLRKSIVAWHDFPRARKLFNSPSTGWHFIRQATKMVGMADRVVEDLRQKGAGAVFAKILRRTRDGFSR